VRRRPLLPRDVPGALEAGEIAAGGGGIDAEQRGERRRRHGATLGDQLERLCLLGRHVAGARTLTTDAPEAAGDDLCCASEAFLIGRHWGGAVLYKFVPGVKSAVPNVRRSRPGCRDLSRAFALRVNLARSRFA